MRTSKEHDYCIQVVNEVLERRRRRNPNYSLRGFARDLGVSASWLSEFFRGQKGMSPERARAVAHRLSLPPRKEARFVSSATASFGRSRTERANGRSKLGSLFLRNDYLQIRKSMWEVLSSWEHYAIIELLKLPGGNGTTAAIATRLGLTAEGTEERLERLARLDMIEKKKNRWQVRRGHSWVPSETGGAEAIRNFHAGMLAAAQSALQQRPAEERAMFSSVFAADAATIATIRDRMQKIVLDFDSELDDIGSTRNQVFGLVFHLFPLLEKESP